MIRLFRVFVPVGVLALLGCEIVLITFSFALASFIILDVDPTVFLLYDGGLTRILLVVASILLGLHFNDLYTQLRIPSKIVLLQNLCLTIGVAFLAQGFISYVNRDLRVPLHIMVLGSAVCVALFLPWRIIFARYILPMGGKRVFLVGGSPLLDEIAEYINQHPETGLETGGYIDDSDPAGTSRPYGKVLGPLNRLRELAGELRPDRIVLGMTERRSRMPVADLLELRFAGFQIEEVATTYERVCGRVCLRELRPAQLIFSELGPSSNTVMIQTAVNLVVALVGAIVSLPLMMITALAVKLTSRGPIFYRQSRVGLHGALFTLFKFRSMLVDAEAGTGAVWAAKEDPRVTPVGRILRSLRLDELPQFFNVLRGDMSIVGPRPERPEFVKVLSEQIPYYRQRLYVKPGITGWAQINHKYGDTLEDAARKLEYDLYYIKNLSQSLDTYIIFHTLKTMVTSRGSQ